jgi:hypothetical protein
MKKYSKLKKPGNENLYVKISFQKDALVEGGPSEIDKDSEPEDENDEENKKDNQEMQWYFNCGSNPERNQILS